MLNMRTGFILLAMTLAAAAPAAPKKSAGKSPATGTRTASPQTTITTALDASLATHEGDSPLAWYEASLLTLEGKGYVDTPTTYSRLPARAQQMVNPRVWELSGNTAGLVLRFATDATTIGAIWPGGVGMVHMARTGSSGLDLYVKDGNDWKFCGVGRPSITSHTQAILAGDRPGKMSEYMLYLPTYDKVTELKLGVNTTATLYAMEARHQKPIVFYGTSITQGGCASRAGMCHVAMLGRWLDTPVINLGFSGSGKSEPELAELVSEIDAAAYVLEPLPNMKSEWVKQRIPGFVRTLRKKHPATPILLVENPLFTTTGTINVELRSVFQELKKKGMGKLHYLYANSQLAGRENGTVDGVHPTDLGFFRMASAYEPMLKMILTNKE